MKMLRLYGPSLDLTAKVALKGPYIAPKRSREAFLRQATPSASELRKALDVRCDCYDCKASDFLWLNALTRQLAQAARWVQYHEKRGISPLQWR